MARRNLDSETIQIEGKVTEIDQNLLCFKIDDKTTVYTIYSYLKGFMGKLPELGSIVKITSPKFYIFNGFSVKTVVLVDEIDGKDFQLIPIKSEFVETVAKLDPQPKDIIHLSKIYDNLYGNFFKNSGKILQNVISQLGTLDFQLVLPNQLRFVSDSFETYRNFSYYTFGFNHPKQNLIGNLLFDSIEGCWFLTESRRKLPCIISKGWDYTECVALIQDYTVITEIFVDARSPRRQFFTMEYLYIDKNKIIKIESEEKCKELSTYDSNFLWTILGKSVFTAQANRIEFWLEVRSVEKGMIFVVLDANDYANIYPALKPGHIYRVSYNQQLFRSSYKEISAITKKLQQYQLPSGANFALQNFPAVSRPVLNLNQAYQQMKTNSQDLISFEGTITAKKFADPIGSRTRNVTNHVNFGTPGHKTHMLQFQSDQGRVTVYLNNWESMAIPYGLVTNMRIIVHNVKAQGNKYFKSTAMTSFEVVGYESGVVFESANLGRSDWGRRFFLGMGVPHNVVVWSRLVSFFILRLNIKLELGKLDVAITLICFDNMGESRVIAKNREGLDLLKLLLGVKQLLFDQWCQHFFHLGNFTYFKGLEPSRINVTGSKRDLLLSLITFFKNIEKYDFTLDLLCRAMEPGVNRQPVYYFLEGRRS